MSELNKLSLKELISESLARDVILFLVLFLLIVAQGWESIFLLLFPLTSFAFSLFFRIISVNKWRIEFVNSPIIYNPFGKEKSHADRFTFVALIQLIFLFWFGAESLYHPQLIDDYSLFFISIFIFIYTFGFFWIFIDLWKFTRLEVIYGGIDIDSEKNKPLLLKNLQNIVSYLNLEHFKMYSILVFLIFIISNFLNLILSFLIFNDVIPGIPYYLPGTGIEESEPVSLSFVIYAILLTSPIFTVIFFMLTHKDINSYDKKKLRELLNSLPKSVQTKVTENLKAINKNLV